ncbi:hypothetical protein Q1695_002208 [Nippostrongylus brasiliensis]|nr:hypothetical protein Q1695_002208 [Nippostrongylus brasiliensis]
MFSLSFVFNVLLVFSLSLGTTDAYYWGYPGMYGLGMYGGFGGLGWGGLGMYGLGYGGFGGLGMYGLGYGGMLWK